ncbi:MAG: CinA family nicotinamide mononucleotide deamidase-related protein [Deltaproteobacteria bacterium]|nr:CinA family nicotinamide mononucleotide deamidase-related protein [Deltaproteobacteria bacterium]
MNTGLEAGRPESLRCEIITIGSELLLGQIVDTNTVYLAKELGRIGLAVGFRTAVGDRLEDIELAIRQALARSDLVITTGGLGPTEDDLTRQAVAQAAGVELVYNQDLMNDIEVFFQRIGYRMPENNRRQAYVPAGSTPFPNPVGTAPIFVLEKDLRPIISLPGVPREIKHLWPSAVVPWIKARFGLQDQMLTYRVLRVVGLGESSVDKVIGDLMKEGSNPEVGLLASLGDIKIRITANADNAEAVQALIEPVETEIRSRLKENIYGVGEDTLEEVVDGLLRERGLTLAVLETFSGGAAATKLWQLPSRRVVTSLVIQDKGRLAEWLGQADLKSGPAVTRAMAEKIRDIYGASVGLVILGFIEDKGQIPEVVGNAAAVGQGWEKDFTWRMGGDRPMLQQRAAIIGLNTLRLGLLGQVES